MAKNDSNNGLYFIVGALFVAVVVLAFFLMVPEGPDTADVTEVISTEPAGGGEENSEFNMNITDDGFSASTKSEGN